MAWAWAGVNMNWSGAVGVGHLACDDGDLVLVEVEAVHAAIAVAGTGRELGDVLFGGAVRPQGQKVDARLALHAADMGETGDAVHYRRFVGFEPGLGVQDACAADQVRGVGAGPVDSENDEAVRRAAATDPMARPPTSPISRTRVRYSVQRRRRAVRNRYQASPTPSPFTGPHGPGAWLPRCPMVPWLPARSRRGTMEAGFPAGVLGHPGRAASTRAPRSGGTATVADGELSRCRRGRLRPQRAGRGADPRPSRTGRPSLRGRPVPRGRLPHGRADPAGLPPRRVLGRPPSGPGLPLFP